MLSAVTTMPPEIPKTFRSPAAHSTGGESGKGTGISSPHAEAPELATSRQDKIKKGMLLCGPRNVAGAVRRGLKFRTSIFLTLRCIISVITARNKRVIYVVVRQGHTFSHRVHHDDGGHRHNENGTRPLERALVQPVGSKASDLVFMAP